MKLEKIKIQANVMDYLSDKIERQFVRFVSCDIRRLQISSVNV